MSENQKWPKDSQEHLVKLGAAHRAGRCENGLPQPAHGAQQLSAAQLLLCSFISATVLLQVLKKYQCEVQRSCSAFRQTERTPSAHHFSKDRKACRLQPHTQLQRLYNKRITTRNAGLQWQPRSAKCLISLFHR